MHIQHAFNLTPWAKCPDKLIAVQNQDSLIGPTIHAIKCGRWPDDIKSNPEMMVMKREKEKFVMRNGLLHRVSKSHAGNKTEQLELSAEFRAAVLKSMHNDMGHLGAERTTNMIQSRFFWPKMAVSVNVKNCGECVLRKSPCQRAAPLHQIVSTGPMDIVCIDFLSMEPDSKGMSNVLVI